MTHVCTQLIEPLEASVAFTGVLFCVIIILEVLVQPFDETEAVTV